MKKKSLVRAALLICGVSALIILWFYLPELRFRYSIGKLNGAESGLVWRFSMNTFNDRITSADVERLYLIGSKRVASLSSDAKSYVYEDSSGYMGCITLIQHGGSYEYVGVFGGNDSDIIMSGREFGVFPSEEFKILSEVDHLPLPSGIIRPWS